MTQADSILSEQATVVVIGAGLAGVVAASELEAAGISDVVVLEARDYIGGRLRSFTRPNGEVLDAGGSFTGPGNVELHKLARSLGVEIEPVPAMSASAGQFVTVVGGERLVENMPLEHDPATAEAFGTAMAELDALAERVPPLAPWDAGQAHEWDSQTIGQWLDANVSSSAASAAIAGSLAAHGGAYETSLLFLLWMFARFGGSEGTHELGERFIGGAAQIPQKLAQRLSAPVFLSTPVRTVQRDDTAGVVVHTDRGAISASAAVLAMEPGQMAKIEFCPPLPPARARLQDQWLAGHGGKFFAIYDRPFWRPRYNGVATGPEPFGLAMDVSPNDGSEGILLSLYFESISGVGAASEILADPERCRETFLQTLVSYFGEEAARPREYYAFLWSGDRWAQGCGTQLPPGVLSRLGPTLRAPIGRLFWAGADSGDRDWMEGAVTSGQRAAGEVVAALRAGRQGA